jgi:hypothetical protein
LLFPDTFNNSFRPGTARAAVEVLEAAGFRVTIPRSVLCCGRPLYDYGMLDLARRTLRQTLHVLRDEIESGVPVIVLEPSCAAVFRDELIALFPDDENARRLSAQTYVLAEFLRKKAPDFRPPPLTRRAILQGHCHQRAIMKMTDEEELLRQMGIEVAIPEPGCCGMAGAFGFERGEHHDDAMRGEGAPAGSPSSLTRDSHHRRRFLLSRTDPPGHGPRSAAPGGDPPDGVARRSRRAARSSLVILSPSPLFVIPSGARDLLHRFELPRPLGTGSAKDLPSCSFGTTGADPSSLRSRRRHSGSCASATSG